MQFHASRRLLLGGLLVVISLALLLWWAFSALSTVNNYTASSKVNLRNTSSAASAQQSSSRSLSDVNAQTLVEWGPSLFVQPLSLYPDTKESISIPLGDITNMWWKENHTPFETPDLVLTDASTDTGSGILQLNRDFSFIYTTLAGQHQTGIWSLHLKNPYNTYSFLPRPEILLTFPDESFIRYRLFGRAPSSDTNAKNQNTLFMHVKDASHPDYITLADYDYVGIRAASIQELGTNFIRTEQSVYYTGSFGTPLNLPPADPSAFRVLSDTFATDGERVYVTIPRYEWSDFEVLPDADPRSFTVLSEKIGKDATHVYLYDTPIPGADSASFRMIKGFEAYFATDKNHVYLMDIPLENVDPRTVTVTEIQQSIEESYDAFSFKWKIDSARGTMMVGRRECDGPVCHYPDKFFVLPFLPPTQPIPWRAVLWSGSTLTMQWEDAANRYQASATWDVDNGKYILQGSGVNLEQIQKSSSSAETTRN